MKVCQKSQQNRSIPCLLDHRMFRHNSKEILHINVYHHDRKQFHRQNLHETTTISRSQNLQMNGNVESIRTMGHILDTLQKAIQTVGTGEKTKENTMYEMIGYGSMMAMIISYHAYESIPWMFCHGLMSWVYVCYFSFL